MRLRDIPLTPLTPRQQTLIVNNVLRACEDISKLNNTGYQYIMLCSGFIAHYNLYGFREAYSRRGLLAEDIMRNRFANRWDNIHPTDESYEYYMTKANVYFRIVKGITANGILYKLLPRGA